MKELLLHHYQKYPVIQIQDFVKLIYQNEFGGGHFIENEGESLERLKAEYKKMPKASAPLFEEIGNGLCRLSLIGLSEKEVSLETINRMFINTANRKRGSMASFEKKLEAFLALCEEKKLPVSKEDARQYLNAYQQQGFPPVSHSEAYREAYHPAYRVVEKRYADFFAVFAAVENARKKIKTAIDGRKQPQKAGVTIAIEGGSGSGKSSLAELLKEIYECSVFHMDDFFLQPHQRTVQRLKHPGSNVDYERFYEQVMKKLNEATSFSYRAFNCQRQEFGEDVSIQPNKMNLVEGVYSSHSLWRKDLDLIVFLETDRKTQKERILKRNGKAMLQRFLVEWIPLENQYFEVSGIKTCCDLIVDTSCF